MTLWAITLILVVIALFCFGRSMYAAGKKSAKLEQEKANERGREYVQGIVVKNANLTDSDLRDWLRKHQNPKG